MAKFFKRNKKSKASKTLRLRQDVNPESTAMYQYARQSYEQTMEPGYSNDDGRGIIYDEESAAAASAAVSPSTSVQTGTASITSNAFLSPNSSAGGQLQEDASRTAPAIKHSNDNTTTATNTNAMQAPSSPSSTLVSDHSSHQQQQQKQQYSQYTQQQNPYHYHEYNEQQQQQQQQQQHQSKYPYQYPSPEPEMVDSTYEENYGDAYVGAPIRYVYPSGYQSMRPRGGPWKLSFAVTVLFTWLSVFIVGHCSDSDDYNYDNNDNDNDNEYNYQKIDDDTVLIETRWCGSRMLYFMWVMSMLITGLAAAYCSVIGYIKVRDFAVANGRSQPPGMVGKSDYYVRISDHHHNLGQPQGGGDNSPSSPNGSSTKSSTPQYQQSIYQADGTPQFWGGHIYRPTQAAVAVTSR